MSNEVITYYSVPDKNLSDFYNFKLISGRFFNDDDLESNEQICVVEEQLIDSGKAKLGGYYKIGNEEYKVIGVIYTAEFRSRVFIPHIREVDKDQSIFYNIALQYDDINNYKLINWDELHGNIQGNQTAIESTNAGIMYIKGVLSTFGIIGIILMLYCLINSYNIIVNRVISNSTNYGIYLAVGASPKKIYLQVFMEIFIFALIALILVFVIDSFTSSWIKMVIEHYIGMFSVIVMFFITFLTSFIISSLTARRLMKHSVIDMIKRISI